MTERTEHVNVAARLDRLPVWPHGRHVLMMVGIGFFFVYFDIYNIGYALPRAINTFHASSAQAATAVSLGLWGYIAGAVLNSVLADRYGRRTGLLTATILYGVGSLLNALSVGVPMFLATRFLSGMGIGASIAVISTYMSEVSPSNRRGRYMAWATFPALFGSAVVPWIALEIVPTLAWGWRLLLALPALGTIAFLLSFRRFPESPRWLDLHGRHDEAEEVVHAAEQTAIARTGASLPPAETGPPPRGERGWRELPRLLRPPYLRSSLMFFGVWFLNYLPVYAIVGLGVTILSKQGFPLAESIRLTVGSSIGAVVGGLISPFIADRWPRKYSAAAATVLLATSLIALGIHPMNILIEISFFLVTFQVGIFAPLVYLLTAEHFPTSVRNSGVALADGAGHVGGAVGPFVALAIFESFGFSAMWVALGLFFVALAILMLFTRDTNGQTLEQVDWSAGEDASPAGELTQGAKEA